MIPRAFHVAPGHEAAALGYRQQLVEEEFPNGLTADDDNATLTIHVLWRNPVPRKTRRRGRQRVMVGHAQIARVVTGEFGSTIPRAFSYGLTVHLTLVSCSDGELALDDIAVTAAMG